MDAARASELDSGPPLMSIAGGVRDRHEVRSVDRAVSLLIALGDSEGEVGVTELARRLGLHKSTASRLLATLQHRGLVEQAESGKFRLGLALVRLGGHAEKTLDLRSVAMAELVSVSRAIKETTILGALEGDGVVALAWSDASGRGHDRIVRNLPLHATAPGKVLLSHRPEREVIRLSNAGFTAYTSHTITAVGLLFDEFARIRERGFATAFGEHELSVNAVAVPVCDHRGSIVAALEVRASASRMPPSRIPELIDRIRDAAAVITGRIGGVTASN